MHCPANKTIRYAYYAIHDTQEEYDMIKKQVTSKSTRIGRSRKHLNHMYKLTKHGRVSKLYSKTRHQETEASGNEGHVGWQLAGI